MVPFYFGDSDKQLFGIYYPPVGESRQQEGILLSQPIAHEHIRTHMAIRQLAHLLSASGYHVLKFDYFAVGDSCGKSFEGSVGQWRKDIVTAYHELEDISGACKISIVGVRLGASIAVETSVDLPGVEDIVLWDPVVNGREYLNGLRLARGANGESHIFLEGREGEEILGFPFSKEMIHSINDINLLANGIKLSGNMYLVFSEERPEYAQLQGKIEAAGEKVETTIVRDSASWETLAGHDEVLVANETVHSIGALFTKGRAG
jgi:pimeloyl-ACP methyl ester carboxylesterase